MYMFTQTLILVSLLNSFSFGQNPNPGLAIFGPNNGNPNSDECEHQRINIREVTVIQDFNTGNDLLTPCIYGSMTTGDIFRIKWFQNLRHLPLETRDIVYDGLASFNVLLNGKQRIKDVWSHVIPSSIDSFIEEIIVNLYSFDDSTQSETLLDSFTVIILRPLQKPGEEFRAVIRTSKPGLWKRCREDSDDAMTVVTSSNTEDRIPIYICVIFFYPICANDDVTDGFTAFSISVTGIDTNGLTVDLVFDRVDGPTNDPEFYVCTGGTNNKDRTFRYVTITNYPQLVEMTVSSIMDSYGELTERVDTIPF